MIMRIMPRPNARSLSVWMAAIAVTVPLFFALPRLHGPFAVAPMNPWVTGTCPPSASGRRQSRARLLTT